MAKSKIINLPSAMLTAKGAKWKSGDEEMRISGVGLPFRGTRGAGVTEV